MRRPLLLLLILCLSLGLYAQKPDLYLGPEYNDKSLSLPPDIVGVDGSNYIVFQNVMPSFLTIGFIPIKLSKERVYIRRFSRDLKPVQSVEVDLGSGRNGEFPIQLIMNPDKQLFLFSTKRNSRNRKAELFVREIDPSTLKIPTRGKKLIEVSYDQFPKFRGLSFSVVRSRDSSKLMIYHPIPGDRDAPERFAIHTFSQGMIPLWQSEFTVPYERDLFFTQRLRIDNEAHVYLLGKRYLQRLKERKGDAANYTFKIFQLNPGQEKPDEVDLGLKGRFMVDVHLEILPNQDLVCTGLYAEERPDRIKGIYYLTLSGVTQEIKSESYKELTLNMLIEEDPEEEGKKKSKRKEKKEQRQLALYDFRDLVLRNDGGAVLIGEKSYTTTSSYYDATSRTWRYITTFHRDDVVALNISPNGEIEQIQRIEKLQASSSTSFLLSYAMAVVGSKLHFVYNDRIENLESRNRPKPYSPSRMGKKKQVVTLATAGFGDDVDRTALISTKVADQFAIPVASMQVSPNELILVFQKGRKRRMAKVTF